MDKKAWINISINILCFSIKAFGWIMISLDPHTKQDANSFENLWEKQAHWFLFDYFGAFIIKISIFVFIFEMVLVYITLASENYEQYNKMKEYRNYGMWCVFGVHILSIIIIEVFNYFYLLKEDKEIKYGFWGLIYQIIKFCVMSIDLGMIAILSATFNGHRCIIR